MKTIETPHKIRSFLSMCLNQSLANRTQSILLLISKRTISECGFLIMIFTNINSQSYRKSFKSFYLITHQKTKRRQKMLESMKNIKMVLRKIWELTFLDSAFIICLMSWLKISCKKKSNIDLWLLSFEIS